MMDADVVVVGVGAMGSMAAWRLAARGARVLAFDQFEPPHDRGSSHGESRIIRTAYFEGPDYVPLVRRSFALWRQLEAESGASLLTMTGDLMIGTRATSVITGALASAAAYGLAHEVLDAAEIARRYPQYRLAPGEMAVYEEDAGFLRPEDAVAAAVGRAEALGATVRRCAPVEGIAVDATGVEVVAAGRAYHARHVVVSVGSWLGRLLPGLRLPLQVERQVVAWFPVDTPDLYTPRRFPVFLWELDGGRRYYGFPSLDGATMKMAVHHEGATVDPDTIDRTIGPGDLEPLYEHIRTRMSGVVPEAARAQVCMYTNTPDEHFLVGSPPGLPSVTLLGGYSGHGFKFAPVMGEIAADLALDGGTRHPIGLFAPDRF